MGDIYFWRQFYVLITGSLFCISVGFMLAYPAVMNPAITSLNSTDITTTRDQASWITASNGFGGILGAFIISAILPVLGRKAAHIAVNIVHLIGWLTFFYANSITSLYAARIIQGISVGGVYINTIIISEYVHPSRRGYFITLKKVAVGIGSLGCHALEPFWNWRQIALFTTIPVILSIVLTMFWPESPSHLALKGRFSECEKSFQWLSGNSEESQEHLKKLIESQMEMLKKSKKKATVSEIFKKVVSKDFRKPILIVTVLTLALDLCGRYYFVAYAIEIMMKLLNDKASAIYFTLGADLLTIFALGFSTIVIKHFNRRALLFIFGSFSVVLMLTVSSLVYLNTIFKFPTEIIWLTAVIIIFLCFTVNIGVVPVSFALVGEVIPLEYRALGSLVSGLVFTFFYALTLKVTPIIISHTGLYGIYAIYGICFAVCLVYLYTVLPETKDKTLQEIEDGIRGTKLHELTTNVERNTLITNT